MTYLGQVKNGVVVFDRGVVLPEGSTVEVTVVRTPPEQAPSDEGATLYERLRPVIGAAEGLPPDLARNHDHYLHGRPRR